MLHFNPLASLPSLLAQTFHVSFSYYSQINSRENYILISYIKYRIFSMDLIFCNIMTDLVCKVGSTVGKRSSELLMSENT